MVQPHIYCGWIYYIFVIKFYCTKLQSKIVADVNDIDILITVICRHTNSNAMIITINIVQNLASQAYLGLNPSVSLELILNLPSLDLFAENCDAKSTRRLHGDFRTIYIQNLRSQLGDPTSQLGKQIQNKRREIYK